MVAFARLRTKSLLNKFWPAKIQLINVVKVQPSHSNLEDKSDKNTHFLDAIKDGGIWFS